MRGVGEASNGVKGGDNGVEGIADCFVEQYFQETAREEVVTKAVDLVLAVLAVGAVLELEKGEVKFVLDEDEDGV
jgi:hypothetical protein